MSQALLPAKLRRKPLHGWPIREGGCSWHSIGSGLAAGQPEWYPRLVAISLQGACSGARGLDAKDASVVSLVAPKDEKRSSAVLVMYRRVPQARFASRPVTLTLVPGAVRRVKGSARSHASFTTTSSRAASRPSDAQAA